MKYLPKSKLGLAAAVMYLLFGFALLGISLFGGGGPHGRAGTALLYYFVVTLPLSAVVFGIAGSLASYLPSVAASIFIFGGLVICAFINAFFIYHVTGFISQISKAILNPLSGGNQTTDRNLTIALVIIILFITFVAISQIAN